MFVNNIAFTINTAFSINTINISVIKLEIIIIEVIETLISSVFLWFLIVGLLLLLTNITLDEVKRDKIGLFFIILTIIYIGKYTDIYNIESIKCGSDSMDFNLADRSKEIVSEASSSTPQVVVTETLPSISKTELAMDLKLNSINQQFSKWPNLYDMPKKDWPMWAKGAIDGICRCAVPHTGPIHCTCNHDLVRTLCWSHMEILTCCKDHLPLADYECAKCYCIFHKECLPEGHTVLKDSSEEWWRTHIRNLTSQGKIETARQKLAFVKHGITKNDYFIQKSLHYENFRYRMSTVHDEIQFRTIVMTKPHLRQMNREIFQAIIELAKEGK